ncbi:hypothetical protein, partial [Antarcticimicrobium sediminis]|uniref:hypothetical protein n=1 Tax=Antarcticimicrobium sediminis TaxID=2546227 RepID=UPI0019D11F63
GGVDLGEAALAVVVVGDGDVFAEKDIVADPDAVGRCDMGAFAYRALRTDEKRRGRRCRFGRGPDGQRTSFSDAGAGADCDELRPVQNEIARQKHPVAEVFERMPVPGRESDSEDPVTPELRSMRQEREQDDAEDPRNEPDQSVF